MSNPTVLEIVKEYLMKNRFDGLYNKEFGCGCPINNLNPCGDFNSNCTAGYQVEAPKISSDDDYNCCICAKRREKK